MVLGVSDLSCRLTGSAGDWSVNIGGWLSAMLNDQAWQWMDGMGYHPYSDNGTAAGVVRGLDVLRGFMSQNSTWASKPIWITEIGCMSTDNGSGLWCANASEEGKAEFLRTSFDAIKTWQVGTQFQIRAPVDWYLLHEGTYGTSLILPSPRTNLPAYGAYKNYSF